MKKNLLLQEKVMLIFQLFLALTYLGVGIFILTADSLRGWLSPTVMIVMGIACIVYGIFRGWRVIYNTFYHEER
jgi:hypothetical protein